MKKYSKPEICIEKFDMDIEILATVEMGSDLYNELKDTYKSTMVPAGAPETDEAFEAWDMTHLLVDCVTLLRLCHHKIIKRKTLS